ncbi:hypothetical protein LWI29_011840 [Acer saccharum]|uniref:Uncharacterized protein n=1 Tax=Acer saccharum TaxID=4024 RepID=A0AA39V955_ACESA|nr:hypothetical protein LWI29_011840 [Acer saccharum]
MAGEGDGSDSRYSQGLPTNELENDATLNTADIALHGGDTTPDVPLKASRDLQTGQKFCPKGKPRVAGSVERKVISIKGDPDRIGQSRDQPKKHSHRRDRSSSSGESEQCYRHKRQRGTVRLHGLNREHREQEPEERGQKLTISQNFNAMGEPEGDRDILIQSLT